MGNLLSTADIDQQIGKAINSWNISLATFQRNIHVEGCPGLTLTNIKSFEKYRRTPLKGSWTLADAGPMNSEIHDELCRSIRLREAQKVSIGKKVVESLNYYRQIMHLLIRGDYCAQQSPTLSEDIRSVRWQLDSSRASTATCAGIYRSPHVPLDERNSSIEGSVPFSQLYRLSDPENANWRDMVNTLQEEFSSAWRRLKRVMGKLLVDEILPIETLVDLKKSVVETLDDVEESFQNFMAMTLGDDPVLPLSVEVVKKIRLQRAIDLGELSAQKDVIKSAGRDSRNHMYKEASAHWKSPLNAMTSNVQAGGNSKVSGRNLVKHFSKKSRARKRQSRR